MPHHWLLQDIHQVGISQFDDDHQIIKEMVVTLHEKATNRAAEQTSNDVLITALGTFARNHFKAEETLMQLHSYPKLSRHQHSHRILYKQMHDLIVSYTNKNSALPPNSLLFILYWLNDHIMTEDRQYGIFLNLHGIF